MKLDSLLRQSVIDNSEKIKLYICESIECPEDMGYDCETCIAKALQILVESEEI